MLPKNLWFLGLGEFLQSKNSPACQDGLDFIMTQCASGQRVNFKSVLLLRRG
jgi:hypothetical protein